jgi:hypothetical protein
MLYTYDTYVTFVKMETNVRVLIEKINGYYIHCDKGTKVQFIYVALIFDIFLTHVQSFSGNKYTFIYLFIELIIRGSTKRDASPIQQT